MISCKYRVSGVTRRSNRYTWSNKYQLNVCLLSIRSQVRLLSGSPFIHSRNHAVFRQKRAKSLNQFTNSKGVSGCEKVGARVCLSCSYRVSHEHVSISTRSALIVAPLQRTHHHSIPNHHSQHGRFSAYQLGVSHGAVKH